jgi:hypothetical protein
LAGIIDGLSLVDDRNGIGPLIAESIFSIDEVVLVARFDAARFANVILPPDRVPQAPTSGGAISFAVAAPEVRDRRRRLKSNVQGGNTRS